MRSIRRSGIGEYAIEGYPAGKFFCDADEAIDLCEGYLGRIYVGDEVVDGDTAKPYVEGKSPQYVQLTPEVLKCLKDGGYFTARPA